MTVKEKFKTLAWLTVFSIAMGYFESAVVVYLREIYYPSGFRFPMVSMPGSIAITEILREACTMIMLFTIAWLSGNTFIKRIAWFIYCFAIWDIFYYVFLKLLVNWPESLLTWDILFLIPMVWTGPVLTPVIASITMILMALLIIFTDLLRPSLKSYWLVFGGAFIMFLSFVWDFGSYMTRNYSFSSLLKYDINQQALQSYVPSKFNWILFVIGEVIILSALILEYNRSKNISAHEKI
ncbi:MAG TPA: hypothetical protein VK179_02970 [Bacteroidales bacterium]|nr:hypothetical protein [Bacteroidales bacterium]